MKTYIQKNEDQKKESIKQCRIKINFLEYQTYVLKKNRGKELNKMQITAASLTKFNKSYMPPIDREVSGPEFGKIK